MAKITRGDNKLVNSCIVTEINLILMLFVTTINDDNNKTFTETASLTNTQKTVEEKK